MTNNTCDESFENTFEVSTIIKDMYYSGMDDCLDIILHIIHESKNMEDVKAGVDHLQILVKGKKFERLRRELDVIGDKPF